MEIAIYFEGGGNSAETKAALRQGMSSFLKPLVDLARKHGCRWTITPCGGRNQTKDAFTHALEREPEKFNLLLVDSENAVTVLPRAHLEDRAGWNLHDAQEEQVHLMAQCMETWLVADPEALADYYQQGFNRNALRTRENLEEEPKKQIYATLESATRQTQKGSYGKIKHASRLLALVDPKKVKTRCGYCDRLFKVVSDKIQS